MSAGSKNRTLPILTGPTAVGKTSISLTLAEHLNAEIISADSRQVYRELTIGTAKPDASSLSRVRHHFIDELELGMPFSAGLFAKQATDRIRKILERGRIPLVVGGSTLYLHALQFGLADIPDVTPDIRRHLESRLKHEGSTMLFEELKRIDPVSAASLDATKSQRLIRALEVYYGTGHPLSHYYEKQQPPPYQFRTLVLNRDRSELYARIEERVDVMLDEGLLDEVRRILAQGIDPSVNALQTIGYQEAIAYLSGQIDYEAMVRLIKRNTRRYAKRQLTWLRRYPEFSWIDVGVVGDEVWLLVDFLLQ